MSTSEQSRTVAPLVPCPSCSCKRMRNIFRIGGDLVWCQCACHAEKAKALPKDQPWDGNCTKCKGPTVAPFKRCPKCRQLGKQYRARMSAWMKRHREDAA